jgi:hypothetical protein
MPKKLESMLTHKSNMDTILNPYGRLEWHTISEEINHSPVKYKA